MIQRAVLLISLFLVGCAGSSDRDLMREPLNLDPDLAAAYSLLYDVVDDEANVSDLFIIRSGAEPTKAIVNDIAHTADYARDELETFAESSPQVQLDAAGLPKAEVAARGIIEGWETKRLMFGDHLDRDLLLSQVEATKYIAALAEHIADKDKDEHRSQRMAALSKKMRQLNEQARRQLQAITLE